MKVAVAGWFGSDNWGDELLLDTTRALLIARLPGAELVVLCPDPVVVRRRHGLAAEAFPTIRPLRSLVARTRRTMAVLRSCDALIIGPGTVFQERSPALRWPGTLPLLIRLVVLARLCRTPVFLFGVGVREGGTRVGAVAVRLIGRLCTGLFVRDPGTAARFGRRADVIGDVAMAAVLAPPSTRLADGSSRLLISLRPLEPGTERALAQVLVATVESHCRAGGTARFLAMSRGHSATGEDDLGVHDRYFGPSTPAVPVVGPASTFADIVGTLVDEIAASDVLVATRLHAAVLGVVLGVPVVAIAYEQKVRVTMDGLGLGDWVLPVDCSRDELADLIGRRGSAPGVEAAVEAVRSEQAARIGAAMDSIVARIG